MPACRVFSHSASRVARAAAAALSILAGAGAARGDDIIRTSGAPYTEVTIVSATWESVTYRKEGIQKAQDVPAEEIEEIRWTSEPATLARGRADLGGDDFERAVSAFKASISISEEVYALNAQYMIGVAEVAWAGQDSSHLPAAVTALTEYIAKGKPKKHFYVPHAVLALSEAHIKAGAFDKASSALADITGGQMGRKWVEAAKLRSAQALLAQSKFAEAREVFREAQGSQNPGFALEGAIGYASCQVGQQQYPAAIQTLQAVLGNGREEKNTNPPRYGEFRAKAWIVYGQAEEGAAGSDKEKLQWAAIRYLRASTVGVAGGDAFAEALFRAKGVFEKLGQQDRVTTLTQRLNQLCPNSPWNR